MCIVKSWSNAQTTLNREYLSLLVILPNGQTSDILLHLVLMRQLESLPHYTPHRQILEDLVRKKEIAFMMLII